VVFKDIGGAEVYPIFEQLKAVKAGVVDLLWTATPFTMGAFPEGDCLFLTFGANAKDFRESGLLSAMDRISRAKNGVAVIGSGTYLYFHLFLNRPIKTLDDLRGMKLRSLASYNEVVQKLGVSSVNIPPAEIYTALKTKVVDGLVFPSYGLIEMGIAEGLEYQVYPPFWVSNDTLIYVNAGWFDSLPKETKDIILNVARKVDDEAYDLYNGLQASETKELRKLGMKPIIISDEEWWRVQELEWDLGRERLRKLAPENAEELIEICSKWYPLKKVLNPPYHWK